MKPLHDPLVARLKAAHERRVTASRERVRRPLRPLPELCVTDGSRHWVNFSSNDYLGLAGQGVSEPSLTEACGSGASALVTGYQPVHQQLEQELADFLQRDAVLVLSSGYMANLAVATSLCDRKDTIVQDRLCHASLIDAARLSGAKLHRYAHADAAAAGRRLDELAGDSGLHLLVTDGVFSMDGDVAPLSALADVAVQHGATLVVDDAHGLGVLGNEGRGALELAGLGQSDVPVLVGTLGKSIGCSGAYIAGSTDLIEHMVNHARSYIYSTALPPVIAQAARQGLEALRNEAWRRDRLRERIAQFKRGADEKGIQVLPSDSAIQPLIMGREADALALSQWLNQQGFLVSAIRPPTVPKGTSRLRITLSAGHSEAQVAALLSTLAKGLEQTGR